MSSNIVFHCLSLRPSFNISKSKSLITKKNKTINDFNSLKKPILKQHTFNKYSNIVLKNTITNINKNKDKERVLSIKEIVSKYYNIDEEKFNNNEKYNEFVENIKEKEIKINQLFFYNGKITEQNEQIKIEKLKMQYTIDELKKYKDEKIKLENEIIYNIYLYLIVFLYLFYKTS